MFDYFLCPLLVSLIHHLNLWVTIFPLLMKNTWVVSWVRSPEDRAWASDLASCDFYTQWFQEEESEGSRIGPRKKLSKDLVSAEDCLSLAPQGAPQMHHRAGPCLVGATLLYLHVSRSWDAGRVGGGMKSQGKSTSFHPGWLSGAEAAVSREQPTLTTGLGGGCGQSSSSVHHTWGQVGCLASDLCPWEMVRTRSA